MYHIGASLNFRSTADAGLLAGGKGNRGRHTWFFTAVDPVHKPKVDPPYTNHWSAENGSQQGILETASRRNLMVRFQNCKRQKSGIVAKNFQCHHIQRLDASRLLGKSGGMLFKLEQLQGWRDPVQHQWLWASSVKN